MKKSSKKIRVVFTLFKSKFPNIENVERSQIIGVSNMFSLGPTPQKDCDSYSI